MTDTEKAALVKSLEEEAGRRCDRCLRKYTRACVDGGRCLHCSAIICESKLESLPLFLVETEFGRLRFRCDNIHLAQRILRARGLVVTGAITKIG